MKKTTNKDMLNAIRNEASAEYQERIPVVTSDEEARSMERMFKDYPNAKNEFINTLMNKVVKTEFFSKVYENPLKMLKKGTLPYGSSIEELFVSAATAKGFYKSGGNVAQDGAQELVGKKDVNVKALYIEKNYAYVFEASISDTQLKAAFLNQNGLSELVNQIVGSLTSGAEMQEYEDMKGILDAAAKSHYVKSNGTDGKTTTAPIPASKDVVNAMTLEKIGNIASDYKKLAVKVRALAGKMKFASTKYNMAGVKTFSRPEDLVFITTPDIMAEMDVNVLAQAFNVSSAEVNIRTILVDELPKQFNTETAIDGAPTLNSKLCYGILMDKDFIQAIDTVNESRQFENGRSLHTNLFLHKQGILANCYFANCVALIDA